MLHPPLGWTLQCTVCRCGYLRPCTPPLDAVCSVCTRSHTPSVSVTPTARHTTNPSPPESPTSSPPVASPAAETPTATPTATAAPPDASGGVTVQSGTETAGAAFAVGFAVPQDLRPVRPSDLYFAASLPAGTLPQGDAPGLVGTLPYNGPLAVAGGRRPPTTLTADVCYALYSADRARGQALGAAATAAGDRVEGLALGPLPAGLHVLCVTAGNVWFTVPTAVAVAGVRAFRVVPPGAAPGADRPFGLALNGTRLAPGDALALVPGAGGCPAPAALPPGAVHTVRTVVTRDRAMRDTAYLAANLTAAAGRTTLCYRAGAAAAFHAAGAFTVGPGPAEIPDSRVISVLLPLLVALGVVAALLLLALAYWWANVDVLQWEWGGAARAKGSEAPPISENPIERLPEPGKASAGNGPSAGAAARPQPAAPATAWLWHRRRATGRSSASGRALLQVPPLAEPSGPLQAAKGSPAAKSSSSAPDSPPESQPLTELSMISLPMSLQLSVRSGQPLGDAAARGFDPETPVSQSGWWPHGGLTGHDADGFLPDPLVPPDPLDRSIPESRALGDSASSAGGEAASRSQGASPDAKAPPSPDPARAPPPSPPPALVPLPPSVLPGAMPPDAVPAPSPPHDPRGVPSSGAPASEPGAAADAPRAPGPDPRPSGDVQSVPVADPNEPSRGGAVGRAARSPVGAARQPPVCPATPTSTAAAPPAMAASPPSDSSNAAGPPPTPEHTRGPPPCTPSPAAPMRTGGGALPATPAWSARMPSVPRSMSPTPGPPLSDASRPTTKGTDWRSGGPTPPPLLLESVGLHDPGSPGAACRPAASAPATPVAASAPPGGAVAGPRATAAGPSPPSACGPPAMRCRTPEWDAAATPERTPSPSPDPRAVATPEAVPGPGRAHALYAPPLPDADVRLHVPPLTPLRPGTPSPTDGSKGKSWSEPNLQDPSDGVAFPGFTSSGGSRSCSRQQSVHGEVRSRSSTAPTVGGGKLGICQIRHNKSAPNDAAVFEGPKLFFLFIIIDNDINNLSIIIIFYLFFLGVFFSLSWHAQFQCAPQPPGNKRNHPSGHLEASAK